MGKKMLFITMVPFLLGGCNGPDSRMDKGNESFLSVGEVGFGLTSANGANTLSKSFFEQGDILMLYLPGLGDSPYRKLTLAPGGWLLEGPVPLTQEETDIYGCYPPCISAMDVFPIEHVSGTDYLYSTRHTASSASPVLSLQMKHALALIEFEFVPSPEAQGKEIDLIAIEGEGLHSRAAVNLLSGELSYEERMHEPAIVYGWQLNYPFIEYDTRISLMVVPVKEVKSDGDITFSIYIVSSKYHWPVPAGTVWEAGKRYTYRITLHERVLHIVDVTVEDWTDAGKEKLPIYYYD